MLSVLDSKLRASVHVQVHVRVIWRFQCLLGINITNRLPRAYNQFPYRKSTAEYTTSSPLHSQTIISHETELTSRIASS
jgi:hypothetical protein